MDFLLQLDQQFFFFINQSLRNPVFDAVMPWLREKYFWIPLYAFIAGWLVFRFRWRSLILITAVLLTLVITDQVASSLIKPLVARLRPCQDDAMASRVHLLAGCGGGFSFVSSHAANHFGFAVFFIVLFRRRFRWLMAVGILWAASVSVAQVYVGLHYPLDVIGGGLLGVATGLVTAVACRWALNKTGLELQ